LASPSPLLEWLICLFGWGNSEVHLSTISKADAVRRTDAPDAIVLGAGVVGMATAYALARGGMSVMLVDKAPEPGRGTSFANGAQLSYAYTDALASPALMARLPALALALDPAFRLRPSIDPDFLHWIVAFLRNCTAAAFRENTLAGLELALESRSSLHELLARHPLEFGHTRPGKLHLYEDERSFAAAREVLLLKRRAGVVQEALTPGETVAVEPALAARGHRLVGAIHSPEEEVGDPFLFCRALLQTLREHYGLRSSFGMAVRRLELDGSKPAVVMDDGDRIEAENLVICAGVDAPDLLRGTGIKVPIWPMKGHSLTAPAGPEAPQVSITDVARKLVFCRLSGMIRVAGLADLGTRVAAVQPDRLASLVSAAKEALPDAAEYERIELSWAGLRPMTPSSLPIIRRARKGVILNVGHGALGWTYAMGAAERAARLLVEQPC